MMSRGFGARSWAELTSGLVLALVLVLAACLASCSGSAARTPAARRGTEGARTSAGPAGEVQSNVLFADYAGSKACESCHASVASTWRRSAMHNMTRDPAQADVRGPFDGTTFHFKGDEARLETVGGIRFVTVSSKKFGSAVYRVTKVIGGHYREDYAGIAVPSANPSAKPTTDSPEELILPVSWLIGEKQLRYKGYSVMVKERPGLRAGPVWNQTCIFCHNTPPFLSTVMGALAGHASPVYQGEVVDQLLPENRRASWVVTDAPGLTSALEKELARLGAPRSSPSLNDGVAVTRSRFNREHLVELGIGCESCHLGSAEHVRNPKVRPSFEPKSAFFEQRFPGEARDPSTAEGRAARINRTCARCHQVLFSGYEHTWEGGTRRGLAGGSNINSGEARDMLLGKCASKLSCAECHAPHAPDATASLRGLQGEAQDRLCTKCHDAYAAPEALRAHTHHAPTGEGSRCLSCHMPQKNLSLDGRLTRYHRIGSPTDPPRVMLDRPLECALCHADATVESLVSKMETWWKRSYDRDALRKLYGSLDANVLVATAERGKPHEQAVAFQLLGEARARSAVPLLASQLTHPYPIVRGYAKRALETMAGSKSPLDLDADPAVIQAKSTEWVRSAFP
ncbi:hypothetical protein [Labilithrix luteola]|nr:hypothetical protein [Labilithrix luteola]